jgi:glutamyl-tRNA reductase
MTEAVVLSTCNRSELYVATTDPASAREELVSFISEYHHVSAPTFQPHLFALENSAAVAHLFRVAAGLDSLVVGEPQILGQVKEAYQSSATKRCVGPVLSNVFRWSFGVGKRVRTETALGEGAVSVSYAAVALARKIFGRLTGRRVLVVGAGEISSLTAQHLRTHGVGEIVITSRTHAHAEELAATVGGLAVPGRGWPTRSVPPTSSSPPPDRSVPSSRERSSRPRRDTGAPRRCSSSISRFRAT